MVHDGEHARRGSASVGVERDVELSEHACARRGVCGAGG